MSARHHGSCLCGEVRFEIEGDFESFYLCHCEHCRKDTGSAHASNLFSTSAQLVWLSGEEQVKTFMLPGTQHCKSFCSHCGSALPNIQMNGQLLAVPAGSLDSKVTIKPNAHIFVESRAEWDTELEKAPMVERALK
ncbi:GFA family protein [Hahella sp. CR1]|uniref:GFA family protein n=1 Tax=Hahella sp. CR1 TaxID=2992807 RepID=UPI002442387D|nr:GFA family protein [Hahella sp. CR1]MDG9670541.1 GFA family protein [Hahella sp. CR1]